MIRILIAEDQAMVRGALAALLGLEPDIEVVATAADVELDERVERVQLAPETEHVVALALREAVTNVVRHAGARRCTLSLAQEGANAVLRVMDDGAGLRDVHDLRELRHGNGLSGMQERAAVIGGKLALAVAATSGLALELRVPAGEVA